MLLWWGSALLTAAVLLGGAIVFGFTQPPGFDTWWNTMIAEGRTEWMVGFAYVMNAAGGRWAAIVVVPLIVIAGLLMSRRWRAAVFAGLCLGASAVAVQLLKHAFGRARPDDMIVVSDFGSFPSGHTANAATLALILWLLFPRVWIAVAGALWVVGMALSRTLLSVHWATDTVGGALVGSAVVLLLAAWLLPWVQTRASEVPEQLV